eukprot:g140.t1
MLTVQKDPYASEATILFQRFTVIVSDLVLFFATLFYVSTSPSCEIVRRSWCAKRALITLALTFFNPGLLLVDHVHFQYNGMLIGLLVLSLALVRIRWNVAAAAVFMSLVMFKHLFVICGPLFFIFMFRGHCFVRSRDDAQSGTGDTFSCRRFVTLATTVVFVSLLALGPVLFARGFDAAHVSAEMRQLLARLFPWGRGLVHAYWAPNVWALYSAADKALLLIGKLLHIPGMDVDRVSLTSGLVGDCAFSVLPSVSAATTHALMILCMIPALLGVFRRPHPHIFLSATIYCYFCYFMLGYHVHEKAILVVSVLLGLVATESARDAILYWRITLVGSFCVFPLLFELRETPIAFLVLLTFSATSYAILDDAHRYEQNSRHILPLGIGGSRFDAIVGCACAVTFAFDRCGLKSAILGERLPFLPLMLYSVLGALWLLPLWVHSYVQFSSRCCLVDEVLKK